MVNKIREEELEKGSPYGYCPKCGAKGISRGKQVDGYDICAKGCCYLSVDAIQSLEDYIVISEKEIWEPIRAKEKAMVKALGKTMGYGQIFQLAQLCWEESLKERGWPSGGEFIIGPCKSTTVSCICVDYKQLEKEGKEKSSKGYLLLKLIKKFTDKNSHCDLCCE